MWKSTLSTDPLQPKGFSGDTNNGYALFSFKNDRPIKLILKGTFPKARFMSVQTYETRFQKNGDSILDYMIEPDAGAVNPFRPGSPMDAKKRNFTLEIVPQDYYDGSPNQIYVPTGAPVSSFFYRIYAPNAGVVLTDADVPKVYAVHAETGDPVSCPRPGPASEYLPLPQLLANVVARFMAFEFKEKSGVVGSNAGIPAYLYSLQETSGDMVLLVKFKAPSFLNTRRGTGLFPQGAQVRYWSMCLQKLGSKRNSQLPTRLLGDAGCGRMVTLVVGSGVDVERKAQDQRWNFLLTLVEKTSEPWVLRTAMSCPTNRSSKVICTRAIFCPSALPATARNFWKAAARSKFFGIVPAVSKTKGDSMQQANRSNSKTSTAPDQRVLDSDELRNAIEQEREWLEQNNAVSAVTGGPVEDQEGVPLPADLHQGTPELPGPPESANPDDPAAILPDSLVRKH